MTISFNKTAANISSKLQIWRARLCGVMRRRFHGSPSGADCARNATGITWCQVKHVTVMTNYIIGPKTTQTSATSVACHTPVIALKVYWNSVRSFFYIKGPLHQFGLPANCLSFEWRAWQEVIISLMLFGLVIWYSSHLFRKCTTHHINQSTKLMHAFVWRVVTSFHVWIAKRAMLKNRIQMNISPTIPRQH